MVRIRVTVRVDDIAARRYNDTLTSTHIFAFLGEKRGGGADEACKLYILSNGFRLIV